MKYQYLTNILVSDLREFLLNVFYWNMIIDVNCLQSNELRISKLIAISVYINYLCLKIVRYGNGKSLYALTIQNSFWS